MLAVGQQRTSFVGQLKRQLRNQWPRKMGRVSLCAAIWVCIDPCPRFGAAADKSPGGSSDQTLVVRLVDLDGKPVEGADVGDCAFFGAPWEEPADESGWYYRAHAVSNGNGLAHITDDVELLSCLVARHVGRKLVAIQSISPRQLKHVVPVTMHPECRVSGGLVCKELEARHQKISWSNVYLCSGDQEPLSCDSKQATFHFYVPPGTYRLRAYGAETHEAFSTVTVATDQPEFEVEPINLAPKRWALLQGQPAPELQDIVAWKNSAPIRLSDLRGKVVILEFWAHWCAPCVADMPALFSLYDKYRERGLVVIGIHVDVGQGIDSAAKLDEQLGEVKRRFWKDRAIPFPVALVLEHQVPFRPDVERKARCPLAAEYGIDSIPTGILIDRRGRVVGTFRAGYQPDEAILDNTLAEK